MSIEPEEPENITNIRNPLEREKNAPKILSREEVRIIFEHDKEVGRYNAAVFKSKSGVIITVREVPRANVKKGIPDAGDLVAHRVTPDSVQEIARLKLPNDEVKKWEDARMFGSEETTTDENDVESEEFSMGLTGIREVDNHPVAAIVKGKITDGNILIDQDSLKVYLDDEGKNVTPFSLTESFFRREGSRHFLEVVEHGTESGADGTEKNKLQVKKIIQFPKKTWCDWQIGTQAQFLPGGILPIHGVNKISLGTDSNGKEVWGYTYSLGLAQLDNNLNVIKVSDTALFNRRSFKNILPMGTELDDDKDVVYCCGYSIENGIVKFVINIGDLMTVEVPVSMEELQRRLDDSSPIASEEMPYKAAA